MEKCNGCSKFEKCEVVLYLKDFVETLYEVNLEDIPFTCPDSKSGIGCKSDLEISINGEDIIIEAKALQPEYLTVINVFGGLLSDKIIEIINDRVRCKELIGDEKSKMLYYAIENIGLDLGFNEGVIFSESFIHESNENKRKVLIKFVKEILLKTVDSIMEMVGGGEEFVRYPKPFSIELKEFISNSKKNSKFKHYKKIEYGSIEGFEDIFSNVKSRLNEIELKKDEIWHNLKEAGDRTYLTTRKGKEELTIYVSLACTKYNFSTHILYDAIGSNNKEMLTDYYKSKFNNAVETFDNVAKTLKHNNSRVKKILFFNNNSPRICIGQEDSLKSNIDVIEEFSKKEENKIIDQVWIEYFETIDESNDLDFAEICYTNEKHYERIK